MYILHPKYMLLLMISCLWLFMAQGQNLTNNGGYIKSTSGSYWLFGGDHDLTIYSKTADRTKFDNVIVDFQGVGNHKLVLDEGSYLTINGALTLNDSLLVKGSQQSMGSLITGTSVTGPMARVQQYITDDRWHYISSPMMDEEISTYMNIYLKSWDETTGSWTYLFYPVFTPLNVGQGYAVWADSSLTGDTLVTFEGLLNTDDVNKSLSYTPGLGNGYHFLGNPYPCGLEWNSSWSKTNVDATIYMYDGTQYLTWNYNLSKEQNTLPDGMIPSTQGFIVHADTTGASITIPKNQRKHQSDVIYKNGDAPVSLKLRVVGNDRYDVLSVYQNPYATEGFDGEYDAYKMYGHGDAPQIYSMLANEIASVNGLPEIKKGTQVDVGFEVGAQGIYSLEVANYKDGNNHLPVFLHDLKEDVLVNLSLNKRYDFMAEPEDDPARFRIIFGDPYADTPEVSEDVTKVALYSVQNTVYIQSDEVVTGELKVTDMLGREISTFQIEGDRVRKFTINAESGYYLVNLITEGNMVTTKLYLP